MTKTRRGWQRSAGEGELSHTVTIRVSPATYQRIIDLTYQVEMTQSQLLRSWIEEGLRRIER